jgi:hypothetical protein
VPEEEKAVLAFMLHDDIAVLTYPNLRHVVVVPHDRQ